MRPAGTPLKPRVGALRAIVAAVLVVTQARAETEPPSPTPTPSPAPAMTKTFVVEPEQSDQTFMCADGRVHSILAFSLGERRIVSIVFVDKTGAAIPADVWSEAYGFRLLHRQTVKIEVEMFCGE